jgi:hypothetical protein
MLNSKVQPQGAAAAANHDDDLKQAGLCHPSRVENTLLFLPGVSLRSTPWLPSNILPGCTVTKMPEMAESRCDFVLQGADGESLMRLEFPGLGGKAESRKLKIEIGRNMEGRNMKTPADLSVYHCSARSLRELPRTIAGESPHSKPNGRIEASSSQLDRLIGIPLTITAVIAESRCDFVLQRTNGEWVMSEDCPERGAVGRGQRSEIKCQRAKVPVRRWTV